jgi:hypothetical protein
MPIVKQLPASATSSFAERWLRRLGIAGLSTFVCLTVAENIANPGLDPLTHEVSEYVNTPHGFVMISAFAGWAVATAALGGLLAKPRGDFPSALCVWAATIGLIAVASFPTQTSAGKLPHGVALSTVGRLHDWGSATTTVALALAAVFAVKRGRHRRFRSFSALLLLLALIATGSLLLVGPSVAGLRQRILVALGCAWMLAAYRDTKGSGRETAAEGHVCRRAGT